MNHTVILLGSTGFVGSAFARLFQKSSVEFLAVNSKNYKEHVGAECDVLINANGSSKKYLADQDPKLDFTLNVRSVINSLSDFKYRLYVYLSTIDVYNNVSDPAQNREDVPIHPETLSNYGFHKYLAELCVRKYARGIVPSPLRGEGQDEGEPVSVSSWLIFRLGGMVGVGLKKNAIHDLLHGVPLRVHPDSAYQYTNTDDVARIVWQLVSDGHKNDIFNLCGDGVITPREVAEMAGIRCEDNGMKKERYEMNLEKVRRSGSPCETREAVSRFIQPMTKKNGGE